MTPRFNVYKIIEKNELILPDWMASALINGDISGLNDEEEAQIDNLLNYVQEHNFGQCVDVKDDSSFYNRPPIDSILSYGETLGGNFCTYVFLSNN